MKKAIGLVFKFCISNFRIILIWGTILLGINMLQPLEIKIVNALIKCLHEECSFIFLVGLFLLFFFITIFKELQSSLNEVLHIFFQNRISKYFFSLFVNNIRHRGIIDYDNSDFLLKIKRSKISIDSKIYQIIANLLQIIAGIVSLFFLSAMIVDVDKLFLVFFIIIFALQLVYSKKITNANLKLYRVQDNDQRKHTYFNGLMRSRESIKEIRISNCMEWIEGKRKQVYSKIEYEHLRFIKKWNLINAIWTILGTGMETLIFLYLVYGYSIEIFSVEEVVLIIQSQEVLILYLISMINTFSQIRQDMEYLKDFAYCCNQKKAKVVDNIELSEKKLIKIQNIFFAYSHGEQILKDCSIEINKGEKIMVVGKNGCGKTTLVKIILGLYKPTKGNILFNKKKGNVVFQDYVRYKFSLRENIGLGNVADIDDEKYIKELLDELKLEYLYQNEKELDVMLGKEFDDDSIDLSGGEWQKIAIGRAMFNKDSDLIILDEPTAALDPIAELQEFNKICEYFSNKTVVLISHRIGLAKSVDKVVYMDNGRICEVGTHVELMKNKGNYYNFYNSQAKWYCMERGDA